MEIKIDPKRKQILDDTFDVMQMLGGGSIVSIYDVVSQVTRYSPGGVETFGLPGEYIPAGAMDWGDYVHPDDVKRYYDVMGRMGAGETRSYDLTYRVKTKDGRYGSFRAVGGVLRDGEDRPTLMGGILINQGMIENTDTVTVLRNQYGLMNDLPELMRGDKKSVIILLGISNFARINETYGYTYGNRVLQQVAWLIQENVGDTGTVYRMDGSKFAFVTSKLAEAEVAQKYEIIRRKLQNAIRVDGVRHNLTANGGLITVKGLNMDPRTVIANLLYAYKESKERKHGALVSYDSGEALELVSRVRSSVVNKCEGFYMRYQPVFTREGGKPIAVEALCRWSGEGYGEILPERFVPILEQDSVFEELGDWILSKAMTDAKKFTELDPGFILGINVSAKQIEKEYFIDTLLQTIHKTGFPAKNLCFELNVDCRKLEMGYISDFIGELRQHGIRFVLDDFGVGVDSFGFMKDLKIEFIKLHKKLIEGVEEDKKEVKSLENIAQMAALCGSRICVKRVETEGERDILSKLPIWSLQGNVLGGPLPADELIEKYLK